METATATATATTKPKPKKGATVKPIEPKADSPKPAVKTKTKKAASPKKSAKPTKAKAKAKPAKTKAKPTKSSNGKKSSHRTWDYDFTEQEVIDSFARNLSEARAEAGLTQQALADAMAYTRIAVCNMERGKNGATLPTLLRLCSVLKTNPDSLLRKRG